MTLTQIRYFLEICRTLNFTKATQNLYVAQPSLSRQIQLLETELDAQLLIRTNRNVVLTPAGEVFCTEFTKIEQEIDAAIRKTQNAGKKKKEIRIAQFRGVKPELWSDFITNMNEFFAGYRLHILQYEKSELVRSVQAEVCDLAIGLKDVMQPAADLVVHEIGFLPAYLQFSPKLFPPEGYPKQLTDFNGKVLVCHQDSFLDNKEPVQMDILKALGITPSSWVYVESLVPALLYSEAATGFTIYFNNHLTGLNLYPVPTDITGFIQTACWRKDTALPLADFFDLYYA